MFDQIWITEKESDVIDPTPDTEIDIVSIEILNP
jgi:hypothetical protein